MRLPVNTCSSRHVACIIFKLGISSGVAMTVPFS
jgi:hypothetical protein